RACTPQHPGQRSRTRGRRDADLREVRPQGQARRDDAQLRRVPSPRSRRQRTRPRQHDHVSPLAGNELGDRRDLERRRRRHGRAQLMAHSPDWEHVTHAHVARALREYDRRGRDRFFAEHGFAPTTTYELVWERRRYPPKAILGTAYEFATGRRLASADFEGGKSGAVKVLGELGFTVRAIRERNV